MSVKPVKFFRSTDVGAPQLNGQAGSLVAVLDACLVNGYNLQTLTDLRITDGVLVGTKSGHGFAVDQVISTTATELSLRSEWTVTEATASTFKASATGISDVVGSGVMTAICVGAGWEKAFSDTNAAAYRSVDPESTRHYLQVVDTSGRYASVYGYSDLSSISVGNGKFPNVGSYWIKSVSSDATVRPWILIASGRAFYLWCLTNSMIRFGETNFFGDFSSEKEGDAYNCCLTSATQLNVNSLDYYYAYTRLAIFGARDFSQRMLYISKGVSQFGAPVAGDVCTFTGPLSRTWISGYDGGFFYPSPASNGLILSPVAISSENGVRCLALPGVFSTPQNLPEFPEKSFMTGFRNIEDRKIISLCQGHGNSVGHLFFDLTGPWV